MPSPSTESSSDENNLPAHVPTTPGSTSSGTVDLDQTTDATPSSGDSNSEQHGAATTESVPPSRAAALSRYRVLRPHASGGLGEVFVAEDTELHREVALKEICARHANEVASRNRFVREAEITGRLEHPGIVPIYSLGAYADGRPFYAMRFIKGDNLKDQITRFHEADVHGRNPGERSLALRGLLRRFIDVCNAVAYAHSRGVLHRDLKPANVMVGIYGETVVVDWGLAKAGVFGQESGVSSPGSGVENQNSASGGADSGTAESETMAGSAIGTVGFMSPEQASGQLEKIGPASDVYSLGATLYFLLVGDGPFRHIGPETALERTQKGDFPPPSRMKSNVPRALEAVCLKSMATRPEDRYPSARDLADDIEHWLADEPVAAYREPWRERARRWVRRHRTVASSVAALVATAVVALVIGLVSVERERRQTAHERDQKDKALQAETHARGLAMTALRKLTDDVVEQQIARRGVLTDEDRRFLREIQRQYEEFAALPGDDVEQRAVRAEGNLRVGVMRLRLGEPTEAEASYERAVAQYQQLANDFPDRPEFRRDLALSHGNLGLLFRANARLKDGEAAYTNCADILKQLTKEYPDRTEFRQALGRCYGNFGVLVRAAGRLKDAEAHYTNAVEVQKSLADEFPDRVEFRQDLARGYNNLGVLNTDAGQMWEAEAAFIQTLAIRKELAAKLSGRPDVRQELARSHGNLARLLFNVGRLSEAEPQFTDAIGHFKQLAADFPTRRDFRLDLVQSQNNLSRLLASTDRNQEAVAVCMEALAIGSQLVAEFPGMPDHRSQLGGTLVSLAMLANDRGDHVEARRRLEESLPNHQEALKANPRHPEYRQFYRDHLRVQVQCSAGLGNHTAAMETAARIRDLGWDPANNAYFAAAALARCVPIVEKADHLSAEEREKQIQSYADKAMTMLTHAVAAGYRDGVHLQTAKDLNPLRSREDFQKLIAQVEPELPMEGDGK